MNTRQFTMVDLFCGAGGMSLGFHRAGFQQVLANEYSVDAEWTYQHNILPETFAKLLDGTKLFPTEPGMGPERAHRALVRERLIAARNAQSLDTIMRAGDVREVLSDKWLKRWLNNHPRQVDVLVGGPPCQGFSSARGRLVHDERNQLVHEFCRVVGMIRPKIVVMENVPGLLHRHTETLKEIIVNIASLGY